MPFLNGRVISNKFFTDGLKGPRGKPGIQGSKGLQGVTGLSGLTGMSGLGSTGLSGVTGPKGETGLRGPTGIQGIGSTGLQGIQGITGFGGGSGSGETGPQGVTGVEGSDGNDGHQGVTGLKGLDGLDGPQGDPGLVGLVSLTSQVSITNTSVETTIISHVLPPGALEVGSQYKFIFYGTHQNQNNAGNLTFRMYIGDNASQSIILPAGSTQDQTYMEFYGLATIRTLGNSGSYINSGIYQIHTSSTETIKAYQGGGTTTTVDTTAPSTVIKVTAQWQTARNTNTLLIQNATIEKVK
jgi:hypothetical protein